MQYTLNVSVKISQHGRPTPDSFALGHYMKIFTVHVAVINVIHATVKKKHYVSNSHRSEITESVE